MPSVVRIQQKEYFVLCTVYFETLGKYLLCTKYLTNANMPTSAEKRAQICPAEILVFSGYSENLVIIVFLETNLKF